MKKIILTFCLFFSITLLWAQPFSSLSIGNGNLTGALQTPLSLGNWASANTPSPNPSYTFSTSDVGGGGLLQINATRFGGTFLLTRGDPSGTVNIMSVLGGYASGSSVTVYNASNQVGAVFNGAGTSYFNGGSVGIGTTNPGTNKLAVEGTIGARKVVVTLTNPFPDYVFQPSYHLPSLDSVAQFIQANHHLSEMPSADSVAKNGLDLGGNQAALLKKIEELTLYTIDLQKQVEDLKKQAEQLRAGNEKFARLQQQIDELKKKKH